MILPKGGGGGQIILTGHTRTNKNKKVLLITGANFRADNKHKTTFKYPNRGRVIYKDNRIIYKRTWRLDI